MAQGVLFAHREHRRQVIEIDADLRRTALDTLTAVRSMLECGGLPPRVADPRCRQCSLRDACLVDEMGAPIAASMGDSVFTPAPVGNW